MGLPIKGLPSQPSTKWGQMLQDGKFKHKINQISMHRRLTGDEDEELLVEHVEDPLPRKVGPKQSWIAKSVLSGPARNQPYRENPFSSTSQVDINMTRDSKFGGADNYEREQTIKGEKQKVLKEAAKQRVKEEEIKQQEELETKRLQKAQYELV